MRDKYRVVVLRRRDTRAMAWTGAVALLLVLLAVPAWGIEDCRNGIDDDANALVDCMDLECVGDPACPEFFDDFESYPDGLNPSQLYEYYSNPQSWGGDTYDRGDLFEVDVLDGNQVLRYHHPAPNVHFPQTGKFLRKDFQDIEKAGFTFYRTQHSPGFPALSLAWQDPGTYYLIQVSYTNHMDIIKRIAGYEAISTPLWNDVHVLEMAGVRIEVEKQDSLLTATVIRLDTGESKTLSTSAPFPLAGRVGFSFYEDWFGPIYFHVDDFLVRGSVASTNRPPVAICADVTGVADQNCVADASIDDGSFDLDGDPLFFSQSPPPPYGLGITEVTLLVEDPHGEGDSCLATVSIEDEFAPSIQCNNVERIVPPDAPIAFIATGVDNCAVESVFMSEYDCFKFTKNGKRVDKTESCEVVIEGATITIVDSGGVGDHITWEVSAADTSGNDASQGCGVEVVNPGQG